MSNFPDNEGRDYVKEQVEAESVDPLQFDSNVSYVRCKCGRIVQMDMPKVCDCSQRYAYWRDLQGNVKRLDQMDLGHLNNCVRMIAAKAEKYPPELRAPYEVALDIFYAEIGSRDQEISQLSGIQAALTRSFGR